MVFTIQDLKANYSRGESVVNKLSGNSTTLELYLILQNALSLGKDIFRTPELKYFTPFFPYTRKREHIQLMLPAVKVPNAREERIICALLYLPLL